MVVLDLELKPLYGGAISTLIPKDFVDASDFRQIPDNQEVFVHRTGDDSVITEILQYLDDVPNEEIAKYHFEQLASDNSAQDASIFSIQNVSNEELPFFRNQNVHVSILLGTQKISKFNDNAFNSVNVYLAIIRLPAYETDILISFNHTTEIAPGSSSTGGILDSQETLNYFSNIVKSFEVRDWGLFGN